ncbi:MAG: cytochrome P450 [Bacteroidota bacterium]
MRPTLLAKLSDLKDQELHEVVIDKQRLIVFRHEGEVKVFDGICPHEGTPLIEGHIEKGHIICPLHLWRFSCQDGNHTDNRACLKSYPVQLHGEDILIDKVQLTQHKVDSGNEVRTIKTLPSPKGTFLLGHLPQFNVDNKHQVLERWVNETGPIFKINFLGKPVIISADPDLNKKVLKARPGKFRRLSKITEVAEEMGVLGVFNAEGDTWKKHRKPTSEALNLRNVKSFFPIIEKITGRLLNKLGRLARENERIDVQREMMRYTVDITTTIAFGYEMNTLDNDQDVIQDHLEKVFPMVNDRITAPIPIWRYFKTKKDRELDRALREIEATVKQFIDEAKVRLKEHPEIKENPTNFLEALLVEQEKGETFSDHEIYGNVFSILLAGEDTTSNSLSWALFYLGQNPEMVERIRNEAEEVYGALPYPVNYDSLDKLPYTEAVAMETLRLKPVAPNLYHQANEDVEINGLFIKKDTPLIFQTKVAQTDEKYFVRAEEFLPERWLKSGCPFSGPHTPDVIKVFGAGTRFCPGKNLAIKEMVMALSMICKNFEVTLDVNPDKVREIFAFSMYPENLWIKLKSPATLTKPE